MILKKYLVVETEVFKSLITKPATGHNREPVPSTYTPQNPFPLRYILLITLLFSLLGFPCVSFPTDLHADSLGLRIPVYLHVQPFFLSLRWTSRCVVVCRMNLTRREDLGFHLSGHDAVWSRTWLPTFRRNMILSSSVSTLKIPSKI